MGSSMTNFTTKTRPSIPDIVRSQNLRMASGTPVCAIHMLAGLLILVASSFTMANAAGLTLEQQAQVEQLTSHWLWPANKHKGTVHPLGVQTISIEKQEKKNQFEPRWATIFQYSYNNRSARLLTVDLLEQRVISASDIPNIHLPLNDQEINFSISLLSTNAQAMSTLAMEYARRPNTQTFRLAALNIKASIYEPNDIKHPCHISRCALMSLFDKSGTVFNLEPIINLDSMVVESLSLH